MATLASVNEYHWGDLQRRPAQDDGALKALQLFPVLPNLLYRAVSCSELPDWRAYAETAGQFCCTDAASVIGAAGD